MARTRRGTTKKVPTAKKSHHAPEGVRIRTAKGGTARRVTQAEVFTERRQSRPGDWHDVASSRVAAIRYDFGLRQIHVIFKDGTPWVYADVPNAVYHRFLDSASKGRFINRILNSYPYYRGSFAYGDTGPIQT